MDRTEQAMESLPSTIEVCIVGAGPSGLACALGLAAHQIPFAIVDALERVHNGSRALGLYAGSLEAIGALNPQMVADLVAAGIQGQSIAVFDHQEKPVFNLDFSQLGAHTKYPFVLLMPQHETEQRMREYLQRDGHSVHFNKRVIDLEEASEGSQYELRFESGEILTARYVVAADGSNSSVRSLAGIAFVDPYTKKVARPGPSDSSFVVADVLFADPANNVPKDRVQITINDNGLVLIAPIPDPFVSDGHPGQKRARLYIGTSDTPPRHPDMAYLQAILDARGPGVHSAPPSVPHIAKVLNSARYRTRPALVDSYVRATKGGAYILPIGDAAHLQGPGGGQGMNLGICDGCELAQAIHDHRCASSKRNPDHILDEYAQRRRAIAREVVDLAEGITTFEAGGVGWVPYLRTIALWALCKAPFVNGLLARKISGLGHARKA